MGVILFQLLKHMKMHRWLHDRKFNDVSNSPTCTSLLIPLQRVGRAIHDEMMKTKHFNFRCMSAVAIVIMLLLPSSSLFSRAFSVSLPRKEIDGSCQVWRLG